MEPTATAIASSLESYKYFFNNEWDLHNGVTRVLTDLGVDFKKEVVLSPGNRIDFLLPAQKIGIEVKVDMSLAGVTRQLWRYADSPEVESMILVTTRNAHRGLPIDMKGKPIYIVYLLNL